MEFLEGRGHEVSMVLGGLAKLKVFWKEWNLRSFIIASFVLQLILILLAPFRKRTSNGVIIVSIWLSYLLADWVAVQAVGLVKKSPSSEVQGHLFAFWAQFLLVHLGGPDTITALALEDNQLWLRTGLELGIQVYATFGVLVRSIEQSNLWAPTIFMFFAGVIKYLERVLSLLHGRITNLDEIPDYDDRVRGYPPFSDAYVLESYALRAESKGKQTNVQMVRDAFYFFDIYKWLYAGQFAPGYCRVTSTYFRERSTPEEAFRVLEIQFNFAYEIFYTKMGIIHKTLVKVLRAIVMLLEVACLVIWYFTKKHGFHGYDIGITYTLLSGAIVVDLLAFFRNLFSDWNIAHLKKDSRIRSKFYNRLLSFWDRTWGRYKSKEDAPILAKLRRAFFRRWSESVSQFNLIKFCVYKRSRKMQKAIEYLGLANLLDGHSYVTNVWFSNDLRDIMFEKLLCSLEESCLSIVYMQIPFNEDWKMWYDKYLEKMNFALPRDVDLDFGTWLIIWHIATDLCYHGEIEVLPTSEGKGNLLSRVFGCMKSVFPSSWSMCTSMSKGKAEHKKTEDKEKGEAQDPKSYRKFCKVISSYMFYLFKQQAPMISGSISGTISKKRFEATCTELNTLLRDRPDRTEGDWAIRYQKLCNDIAKGEFCFGSKDPTSVLIRAVGLAMSLQGKWDLMAGMWVLGLCYAAKHSKPNVLAAQLKQGGELLSFVWLLMVQLNVERSYDLDDSCV